MKRTPPIAAQVINIVSMLPPEVAIGQIFLFGSALSTDDPTDIDILIIIDEFSIAPSTAYSKASPMIYLIETATGKSVDLTILTTAEELKSQFSKIVNARPILSEKLLGPT